jgi:septum formation protein
VVILASKSPRRKELLAQLGFEFLAVSADIDESIHLDETPRHYVERLAIEKAQAIANFSEYREDCVLGSDTAVVINNEILGKPANQQASAEMLAKLSNTRHQVYTSIAVVMGTQVLSQVVVTHVDFKALNHDEITAYWQTGEPQDKAGSYGIQGLGGQFVKSINGSYSSVVGLPLVETAELLTQCGIKPTLAMGVIT